MPLIHGRLCGCLEYKLPVGTRLARSAMTSFLIVDAQSVKNTNSADLKGYDAGKKVLGIKRHIAVDSQGLPHAVVVTTPS